MRPNGFVRLFRQDKFCIVRKNIEIISGVNYAYNKSIGSDPKGSLAQGFHEKLTSEDLSPVTVRGYLYDINNFRSWLTAIHGREPALEQLLTVDLAAYRQ